MCRIAAETRIAYLAWSAQIGDHFAYMSDDYLSIDGKARRLRKENERREREVRRQRER